MIWARLSFPVARVGMARVPAVKPGDPARNPVLQVYWVGRPPDVLALRPGFHWVPRAGRWRYWPSFNDGRSFPQGIAILNLSLPADFPTTSCGPSPAGSTEVAASSALGIGASGVRAMPSVYAFTARAWGAASSPCSTTSGAVRPKSRDGSLRLVIKVAGSWAGYPSAGPPPQ